MANKISYGLQNVYYAVAEDDGNGNLTYGTPQPWKGGVNLSLSAEGSSNTFYADNVAYFVTEANNGYSGDLEMAEIPDAFRVSCLGEVLDTKGFYVERADDTRAEFALLFQFEGDESATRHCLYRCTASRPDVASATTEDTVEPQTKTVTITAMPRISDGVIKSRCPASATTPYAAWFTTVQEPTA